MNKFDSFVNMLLERATKVVMHGFSDRGISSVRYTILDTNGIKLNQRPNHGTFNDDYETVVYNSLEEAFNSLKETFEEDGLNDETLRSTFLEELVRNGTIVVYSFHKGNHFREPTSTTLIRSEGEWTEVPIDYEDINEEDIIKEYTSTEQEYDLRRDIPYEEVNPAREREDNFFRTERYTKTINLPKSAALDEAIKWLSNNILPQVERAKSGEYDIGQMQAVKDNEVFLNLLKQGELTGYDSLKFVDKLFWVKKTSKQPEQIQALIDYVKNQFKGYYVGWGIE